MSLAALLLGLPGKVFRLRGHNAPATPVTPATYLSSRQYVNLSSSIYSTFQQVIPLWGPDVYTEAVIDQLGLNNSAVVSTEVCSLSGKGAIDGAWIKHQQTYLGLINGTVSYGMEILVDGVNILPAGWKFTQYQGYNSVIVAGALGVARIDRNYSGSSNDGAFEGHFGRMSSPIPFNSSLVVNLIHYETPATTYSLVSCWVNAWLTE